MKKMSLKEVALEASKAVPPVGVVGANRLLDVTLSDAVMLLTLVYTAVQLGFFLYDRYNLYKAKRDAAKE
jgi:hypothetical protein